MRKLNVRSGSAATARNLPSEDGQVLDPSERLSRITNLVQEIAAEGVDVDAAGDLNTIYKQVDAALKAAKTGLKDQCREKSIKALIGNRYTMTMQQSSDWNINPVNLVKWLKDHAKMELFPSLVKAKVTEIKNYLGAAMLNEVGTMSTDEYGSCRFKEKK